MCLTPHMYKFITLKWQMQIQGNHHFKMCLTPNMYKIVTLKTNAKEIITLKCF